MGSIQKFCIFWFELTNLASAKELQNIPSLDHNKGIYPTFGLSLCLHSFLPWLSPLAPPPESESNKLHFTFLYDLLLNQGSPSYTPELHLTYVNLTKSQHSGKQNCFDGWNWDKCWKEDFWIAGYVCSEVCYFYKAQFKWYDYTFVHSKNWGPVMLNYGSRGTMKNHINSSPMRTAQGTKIISTCYVYLFTYVYLLRFPHIYIYVYLHVYIIYMCTYV